MECRGFGSNDNPHHIMVDSLTLKADMENAYNPLDELASLYGDDLAAEQLALEAEAYRLGEQRFLDAMDYKAEAGQAGDTKVARPLIAELLPKLSMKLIEFIASQQDGRPGKKAASFKYIRGMDPDRIAYLGLRTTINLSCIDGLQPVALAEHIGRDVEDEARFGRLREQDEKAYKQRIAPEILKRSADHFKRAYARAVEVSMNDAGDLGAWDSWGTSNRVAVGLKVVELMIEIGFIVLSDNAPGNPRAHKKIVTISDEVSQWVSERKQFLAGVNPVWGPTVVPPKPWTGIHRGGYWGRGRSNPKLIRGLTKKGRKRYYDVDLSNVMDSVNHIQATPWHVNAKVLEVAREVSRWTNIQIDGMASPEVVAKPTRLEGMDDDEKILKAWKREAAKTWRKEKARRSRRLSLEHTLSQADRYVGYERIWFPYNLDFRSRVYAIPSFSPQGNDLSKGLLMLADPSPMGKDGEYWLRMHIANVAGLDKEPMDVRQQWTYDNEELILACANDPLDHTWWATDSDSPFCFLAAALEFRNWKASHNPEEYRCGLAIAFDGSCSGIQHFSAMLRDEVGGAAVNLTPGARPSDIYRIVADKVQAQVNYDLIHGTDNVQTTETCDETGEILDRTQYGSKAVAHWWNTYGITRKVTKRSVMTLPYGSKEYGFADQILEDIIRPAVEKQGDHVFPAPGAASRYMAALIWDALETTVVAAVGAMNWLQKAAGALASQDMPAHWVTPVGFPVWQEYRNKESKRVDTMICGSIRLTMTVQLHESEKNDTNPLNRHKQVNAISPNFVHSMDASHLMLTALAAAAQGVQHFAMIHDSFGTCPGNAGVMFRVVREVMVKTYMENDVIRGFYEGFVSDLTEEAHDKIPDLPEQGNLNLEDILLSKYCFC